jgi:hypothetical protein
MGVDRNQSFFIIATFLEETGKNTGSAGRLID